MHLNDTLSSISKDMKQQFFMNENLLNVYLKNLARQNILMKTIVKEIISYCHLHCKKRRKDWLIWKVPIKNQLCYWISRHSPGGRLPCLKKSMKHIVHNTDTKITAEYSCSSCQQTPTEYSQHERHETPFT